MKFSCFFFLILIYILQKRLEIVYCPYRTEMFCCVMKLKTSSAVGFYGHIYYLYSLQILLNNASSSSRGTWKGQNQNNWMVRWDLWTAAACYMVWQPGCSTFQSCDHQSFGAFGQSEWQEPPEILSDQIQGIPQESQPLKSMFMYMSQLNIYWKVKMYLLNLSLYCGIAIHESLSL